MKMITFLHFKIKNDVNIKKIYIFLYYYFITLSGKHVFNILK